MRFSILHTVGRGLSATFCAALVAMLASCSGTPNDTSSKAAPPAAEEPPKVSGVIVIPVEDQKKGHIETVAAKLSKVPVVLTVAGRITLNDDITYHVSSLVPGKVVSVFANIGDPVKPGETLALIQSDKVHEKRIVYVQAAKEVVRLETLLRNAERIRDRASRLYENQAGSKAALDQAEVDVRTAKTQLEAAEIEKERARDEVEDFLRVSLPDASGKLPAGEGLDDILIKAPAAGILTQRNFTAGTVVDAAQEGFQIADLSSVWMMASVHEADIARVRVGESAKVKVQSYPGEVFPGRVTRIDAALDPETRTIQARVLVPNPEGKLRSEMYATVDIQSGGTNESILLPETAIQSVNGVAGVFVRVAPDRFEPRPVTTGATANGQVEVSAGVQPGDEVVIRGAFLLKSSLMRTEAK